MLRAIVSASQKWTIAGGVAAGAGSGSSGPMGRFGGGGGGGRWPDCSSVSRGRAQSRAIAVCLAAARAIVCGSTGCPRSQGLAELGCRDAGEKGSDLGVAPVKAERRQIAGTHVAAITGDHDLRVKLRQAPHDEAGQTECLDAVGA
jgi:hypothetical protein